MTEQEITSTTEALIPVEDQALLDSTREQFAEIVGSARNFVVADDDGLERATDMVKVLKKGQSNLEKRRKELVGPYNEHVKTINNAFKKISEMAKGGIQPLSSQMTQYHLQVEARLRKEEEERRRLEAEALKAQEDELAEAAELEGKNVEAEMEKVHDRQHELAGPMVQAPKSVSRGNVGSSSVRKTWTFTLKDITKVPSIYLQLNEVAIRNAIASGHRNIAGIEIFQKSTTIVR